MEQDKAPKRLPVAPTRAGVQALLTRLVGAHWLMVSLLYSDGLRLMEHVDRTMICSHVLNRVGSGVACPLDGMMIKLEAHRHP